MVLEHQDRAGLVERSDSWLSSEQLDGVTHGTPVSGAGYTGVEERRDVVTHGTPASGTGFIVAEERLDGVPHDAPASGAAPS